MGPDTEIEIIERGGKALQSFYDIAAGAPPAYKFFSPISLPEWRNDLAHWLCAGSNICEVGPGKGDLARRVAEVGCSFHRYLFIDISKEMLESVKGRLAAVNPLQQYHYLQADIESHIPAQNFRQPTDRLVAVNVLQDVDIRKSLRNISNILTNGALLKVTLIAKETQDSFWKKDPEYDRRQGLWYASSRYHFGSPARPMGYRLIGGRKIPFHRILHCHTKEDIPVLFGSCGYKVKQVEPIIYPIDYVIERWNSKYHYMKLSEEQKELLEEWRGYPDGWCVTAVYSPPDAALGGT